MLHNRSALRALLVLGLWIIGAASTHVWAVPSQIAEVTRLDEGRSAQLSGFVDGFQVSPDGAWVVYVDTYDSWSMSDLLSVPADGSAEPVRLNAGRGRVTQYRISPDSRKVFYREIPSYKYEYDGTDIDTFCSVDIAGGASPVILMEDFSSNSTLDMNNIKITPDSQWAIFRNAYKGLFAVPLDGSQPAVLLPRSYNLSTYYDLMAVEVSPDSRWVVYESVMGERHELRSTLISDPYSTNTLLLSMPETNPLWFRISSDSRSVAFLAGEAGNPRACIAPLDGSGSPISVTSSLGDLLQVTDESRVKICPDNSRFVFNASTPGASVYSAAMDGSDSLVRLDPTEDGENADWISRIAITPDSSTVLYIAAHHGIYALYRASVMGGMPPEKISNADCGEVAEFHITPDGSHVVYRTNLASPYPPELYSLALSGSASPVKLNIPLGEAYDTISTDFLITPDSQTVFCRVLRDNGSVRTLYSVPVNGASAPRRLDSIGYSVAFINQENQYCAITADGQRVVYNKPEGDNRDLYSVLLTGGEPVALTDASPVLPEVVHQYVPGPDGKTVVFTAHDRDYWEMFEAPVDASAPATLVTSSPYMTREMEIQDVLKIGRVRYRVSSNEGYNTPLDGSEPPVRIFMMSVGPTAPVLPNQAITPDGRYAFCLSYNTQLQCDYDDMYYCWSVFSGSGIWLTDLTNEESIEYYSTTRYLTFDPAHAISPDGRYLVFRDTSTGLQIQTLEGVSKSNQSGDPSVIHEYAFTPDSAFLLLRGGNSEDVQMSLYRRTIGGSGELITLVDGPVVGMDVERFMITPDSQRVVFLDLGFALYSRAIGEPGEPVVLFDGDPVDRPAITPDGRHVVFTTASIVTGARTLWTVPADGSSPAVMLCAPSASGGFVRTHEISPDGQWIAYQADLDNFEVFELYAVPVDGSAPSQKLNPDVGDGLGVRSLEGAPFRFAATGAMLSFCMANDMYELYSVSIGEGEPVKRSDDATAPDSSGLWMGDTLIYGDVTRGGSGGLYSSVAIPYIPPVEGEVVLEGSTPEGEPIEGNLPEGELLEGEPLVEGEPIEGGLPEGELLEGEPLVEGEPIEGSLPEGETLEGEPLPEGESIEGSLPEGGTPEGEPLTEGEPIEGSLPEGRAPEGEALPEGESIEGSLPEGEVQEGEPLPEGEQTDTPAPSTLTVSCSGMTR